MNEQTKLKYPDTGKGTWDDEPDRLDFTAFDCDCTLRRGPSGAWCGYVKVPVRHILHGVTYSTPNEALNQALEDRKNQPLGENPGMGIMLAALCGKIEPTAEIVFQVHGGLTYSETGPGGERNDGEWWYGFDCSHCDDLAPKHPNDYGCAIYRNMAYARTETENLAAQIAALDEPAAVDAPAESKT